MAMVAVAAATPSRPRPPWGSVVVSIEAALAVTALVLASAPSEAVG
jgi:hypothetical protein